MKMKTFKIFLAFSVFLLSGLYCLSQQVYPVIGYTRAHGAAGGMGSTAILDNFNRANESPIGGNWSSPLRPSDTKPSLISNQMDANGNSSAKAWWNASQFGPNCEAYYTITYKPSTSQCVNIMLRASNVGLSTLSGYWGEACTASGADTWDLYRFDSGTPTHLGTTGTNEFAVGDGIGIEAIGSAIKLYQRTSGVWTVRVSVTDTTYTTAGYLAVGGEDTPQTLDDFGGGNR
jgi:hypothetical protein